MPRNLILLPFAVSFLAVAVLWATGIAGTESSRPAILEVHPTAYVGQEHCAGCHASETAAWRDSHHAKAMGVATASALASHFTGAKLPATDGDFTSFIAPNGPMVRLEATEGKPADFPIAYTFGVYPLQQYLVPFSGGRYQVLPFAWDARPLKDGGQRWFNLYPGSAVAPGDQLHWTNYNQTWNSMCADCHSTALSKGYDALTHTYRTTWSDISVACEACHGPGAKHVDWAEGKRQPNVSNKGFEVPLRQAGADGHWGEFDSRGIRRWKGGDRHSEIDRCASCHSRRRALQNDAPAGKPLLDANALALLDDELYFPDGQIKDEVFELGSFLQSRMWHEGVVCTDCHEPHSGSLKADGNAVCARCHDAQRFDVEAHHHHAPGTEASKCTTCHMPSRTYMGVHVRHDHSFRLPAPARAQTFGSPDPCTSCHADRGVAWAEAALDRWTGGHHRTGSGFADALAAGRARSAGAQKSLITAATDASNPPIARATALSLLARFSGPAALPVLKNGLTDADPLVRLGAVRGAAPYRSDVLNSLLSDLLRDPRRAVRSEAARLLAPNPDPFWSMEQRQSLDRALGEWVTAEEAALERPESRFNLGTLWADLGKASDAEGAFKDALTLDPRFTSAVLNLADLYRSLSRNDEAEKVLRDAVALAPTDADAHYALGLALVRRGQRDEALAQLEKAVSLKPEDVRFVYTFGLGLAESGNPERAIAVLDEAHRRFPDERDLLVALIALARQAGNADLALQYSQSLSALDNANGATEQAR
jgi:predicted CXXCH cytochrome family protein